MKHESCYCGRSVVGHYQMVSDATDVLHNWMDCYASHVGPSRCTHCDLPFAQHADLRKCLFNHTEYTP